MPILNALRRTSRHLALAALILVLSPPLALATSFDFVSSAGRFSIAGGVLALGNGLTISAAELGGLTDDALLGASVLIDPLVLDGTSTTIAPGIVEYGIDDSMDYMIKVYQTISDGGALLFSAVVDPGSLLVTGTAATLSGGLPTDDLSAVNVALPGFSDVLDDIGSTTLPIDFNVALSAAGQDIAQQIEDNGLVLGAVAGTVFVIPEPGPGLLTALGLAGLSFAARREGDRDPRRRIGASHGVPAGANARP